MTLEELKGKIIGLEFKPDTDKTSDVVRLLEVYPQCLKIMDYEGSIWYIPYSSITAFFEADTQHEEKFYSYEKEYKNNPSFEGDSNKDKGYTIIKKRKNV